MIQTRRPLVACTFQKLLLLLALLAILLPVFGPWLSVEVAALLPDHKHVYLGEVHLDHHDHHAPAEKAVRIYGPFPLDPCRTEWSGVINLFNLDASGRGGIVLPLQFGAAFLLLAAAGTLAFIWQQDYCLKRGIAVLPSERPPCLLSSF